MHLNPSSNELIGKMCLKLAADHLPDGKGDFAILSATSTSTNQNIWIGVMKKVLEQPEFRKMKLVSVAYGDDQSDKSYREAIGLLRSYPQLKAIIAPTTVGINAASKAVVDEHLVGKVFVTGTDGSSDVVKLIETGDMLSTMSGLNEYQGAMAAALAYAVRVGDLKLEDLSEAQRDFNVQQVLITKENAAEFLARRPDPADFTYESIKADIWAKSAGQIPPGVN